MNKKILTRILAAVLICLLLPVCTGLAEKAYVMKDTRAYAKPDTSAKYFSLSAGAKVNLVAEQDGWSKIKKNGKAAFVDSDDVAVIKTYNGKTMYMSESAAMLKDFTGTKTVLSLEKGDKVSLLATSGGWAYIKKSSKKGFVKESLLTKEKPDSENPGTTAYVSVDNAKLYKKQSSSSKVLERLSVNTAVTVLASKDSWCRVKYGEKTGFMKKNTLSSEKTELPVEDKFDATVAVDSAKVFKKCSVSSKVLATLEKDTAVTVTAYTSEWCRVEHNGKEAYMKKSDLVADKPAPSPSPSDEIPDGSSAVPAKGTAIAMDWWTSDISSIFSVGTVAVVTDVETGIAWNEKRMGGTNHADVQPVTSEDTAAMKSACGSWSWDRRAIFVTINGVNYAASMNCMPHGSDSISGNNFDGHHCIHFTNSRTHTGNKICDLHQAAIRKALAANLK